MELIHGFIETRGRLIASTAFSSIGINMLLGEQYLSIILSGNAFIKQYEKLGLARKNMSRVLEDAGTVVNPLVPWSVCGVFLTGVLGVSTIDYLPFAFFCLLCPVLTILLGFTGIGVPYETEKRS
jgi:NhaC family Na+:H+ antiporter